MRIEHAIMILTLILTLFVPDGSEKERKRKHDRT